MKKIEIIDKDTCKGIRAALNPIIEKFMQDTYGLKADLGNASYTDKSVTFKLEIKAEGVSSLAQQTAKLYGWPEIGTTFTCNSRQFKVIDYDIKKRSKPIIITDTAIPDSRYAMTAENAKSFIAATPR